MAFNPATVTILALLPLIAWRMVSRVRRMVGRQKLTRIRPWITLLVFPLVVALLCVMAREHLERLWWLAATIAFGLGLAAFGLKHTRFEATGEGLFYTPNAHLGIALSALFIGRILWRLGEVLMMTPEQLQQPDDFTSRPLTLAIFGLLCGYYIGYSAGLLAWRFRVRRERRVQQG